MQSLIDTKHDMARRRRGGRPSAEQVGEVDRRILDSATDLFLRLGFDATSCDQIVLQAGAGKASLYARYANKEELFAAVVRRIIEETSLPSLDVPWHLPARVRLKSVADSLLSDALSPRIVALMRVCVTTAHRMPGLARMVDRISRDSGVACIARALVGDEKSRDRIAEATDVAGRFIDTVFVPQQMRALIGDDHDSLRQAAPRRINDAIDLFGRAGLLAPFETTPNSYPHSDL